MSESVLVVIPTTQAQREEFQAIMPEARFVFADQRDTPPEDPRGFDIILGLEAGVRMSDQYELRFGYDWGLLKAAKEGNAHHNVLHIGLAYKF